MSQKENDNEITIREHVYDGIQEYDQKLPNWWLFTLYITMVWFVIAWFVYYQTPMRTLTDEERVDGQIAVIEEKKKAELEAMLASISNESLKEMSADASHTASGKAIFETKCAACHGFDLSATLNGIPLPGVPLNDSEWKYGSTPLEIMKLVTEGSPDLTKGMIPWKTQLGGAEIAQVVAYILSKQPQP
jgi:cytochrome c oxidase cbb3-type subunit III